MDAALLLYLIFGYTVMAMIVGWAAYRSDFGDEVVILCAFFWPIALPLMLFAGLVAKIDEIMWERSQEPENSQPGRVIQDIHQRHAAPGDPDHWGSE